MKTRFTEYEDGSVAVHRRRLFGWQRLWQYSPIYYTGGYWGVCWWEPSHRFYVRRGRFEDMEKAKEGVIKALKNEEARRMAKTKTKEKIIPA